jgi:hypothetical protein
MNNHKEIEEAKALLKNNGYQVDNLWRLEDVKSKFKCTNEQAQSIMSKALTDEETIEQIWFAIVYHGEDECLEPVEEEE